MAQVFTSLLDRPHVKRTWRPLQALSRALIVGTFVDDFVRIASDYTGQVDSMRTVGFGDPASSFLPALFCAVQGIGAGLVLRAGTGPAFVVSLLAAAGLKRS